MDEDLRRKIDQLTAEAQRYRDLVDNASDVIFCVDLEGVFTFVSRAALPVLGYTPEEMVGRPATLVVAPEHQALLWANRDRKLAGEPVTEYRVEAIRKDGARRWLAIRTTLVGRGSQSAEIHGLARDITESRRVERALRESEERLRLLVRATNDAIWDRDLARDMFWWSGGIESFGYSPAEIRPEGEWWRSRLHPDDRARVMEASDAAAGSAGDFWAEEYRFLRKDGAYADVYDRGFVIRDTQGNAVRMIGAMLDVSRRKQAERAVQATAERFALLFENHPQPIFVFDSETLQFLEVNRAAAEKYGYSRDEFLGMRVTGIRPPEDVPRFLEHLNAEDNPRGSYSGNWRHVTREGKLLEVEILSRRLSFAGRPASLVVVLDVTHRRALEYQLLHAQRMEAVGRLAGGVAHDFNNLLTVISGYCQLLLEPLQPYDPSFKALDEIRKATERAAGLTQQLLAFSRRQAIHPRLVDLRHVVDEMHPMLTRLAGEKIELELDLPGGADLIKADPRQLEQVVMNLVVNARDAMPEGGRVRVAARTVTLAPGQIEGKSGGSYAELSVADHGEGMDEETLAHIFEPFFSTKEPGRGTGLGLSTVYGIVEQSGGFIQVDSKPGEGSVFRAFFPSAAPAKARPPGGGETILLVDGQPASRRSMAETLRAAGYQVTEAAGSLDALELAARQSFDLLISDLLLPGMNGLELAARLKRIAPSTRLLYVSTAGGDQAAGGRVLRKPVSASALLEEVRAALDDSSDGIQWPFPTQP